MSTRVAYRRRTTIQRCLQFLSVKQQAYRNNIMTVLSKLGNPVAAAASTALTAALIVAVNTTRKRRRQGGPDIVPTDVSLARPGGRGGTRPNRKPPSPRYKGKSGKQAWLLKHDKTQFYHDYIEHVHLARDPTSVLGKAFKAKFILCSQQHQHLCA